MNYKAGDRVKAKSLDWYNENKDKFGKVWTSGKGGRIPFDKHMSKWCGKVMTISDVRADHYTMIEDLVGYWTDQMIEGLVEEETKVGTALNPIELKSNANCLTQERVDEMSLDKVGQITDFEYEGLAYTLPDGYQFVDENGNIINATKIVLEKKKKEYPKTYDECCKVLNIAVRDLDILDNMLDTTEIIYSKNLDRLLNSFRKLLICRDAYWKIAGEEMGLGEPWKPDYSGTFEHGTPIKYVIYNIGTHIVKERKSSPNHILAFPTEEMGAAFYENFKELIEQCKELL